MNYSSNTCDELLQILKYIDKKDREKIPNHVINYLYQNCNSNSTFIYNQALPLEEQNLHNDTIVALRELSDKYWQND